MTEMHEGTGKYEGLVHDGRKWYRRDPETGELVRERVGFWQRLGWSDKGIILSLGVIVVAIASYVAVPLQEAFSAGFDGRQARSVPAGTSMLLGSLLIIGVVGVLVFGVASVVAAIRRRKRP